MEFLKEQFGIKFEFNNNQSVPKIIKIGSSAGIGMDNVGNNYQESHAFRDDKDSLLIGQYLAGFQSVQCNLVNYDNEVLATEIVNSTVGFEFEKNYTIVDSGNDQNGHEEIEVDENEDYLDHDSLSALKSISITDFGETSTSQIEEMKMENDEEENAANDDLPDFEKNQPDIVSESIQKIRSTVRNSYICEWANCGKRFTRRDNLNRHKNTHTGKKQFKCIWPNCESKFARLSTLAEHKRTHTGEKPYKCDWPSCESKFAQKCSLASHNRTHTGEKPYKCDWPECGSRFADCSTLRQHKNIHTGEKPFKCGYCNATFQRKKGLEKHLRAHTGEAPFNCKQCGRSFKHRSTLNEHKCIHLPSA